MNSKDGNLAVCALAQERGHPRQSFAIGSGRSNSGTDQCGLAGVDGEVLLIVGSSIGVADIGLGRRIGLVETHEMGAAVGKGSLNGGSPIVRISGTRTPQHRHILNT